MTRQRKRRRESGISQKDEEAVPARLLVWPAGQPGPLLGENQLFRYLARTLVPAQYEAAGAKRAARVDRLVELADSLLDGDCSSPPTHTVLAVLEDLLTERRWLLADQPSLVDGVVWSAVRGAALRLPANVAAWSSRLAAAIDLGDDPFSAPASKASIVSDQPAALAAPAAAGGGGHLDQTGLLALLADLNITAETIRHPAVFTVEAMLPHLAAVSGAITKNLFLRDKKKTLYLLTARHDAQFRLSEVARQLAGAKELRFGDEVVLYARLGVRQGCVTPLALVNDTKHAVRLLVDSKMLDGSFDKLWFHPLTNEATMGLGVAEFRRFLAETGHVPTLVNL